MKYMVFTTRHCDGFSMFDMKTEVDSIKRVLYNKPMSGIGTTENCRIRYSVIDTPYQRDVTADVVHAFRKKNLGIGLYYSWWDWHDLDCRSDKRNMYYDSQATEASDSDRWKRYAQRLREQLRELCTN